MLCILKFGSQSSERVFLAVACFACSASWRLTVIAQTPQQDMDELKVLKEKSAGSMASQSLVKYAAALRALNV